MNPKINMQQPLEDSVGLLAPKSKQKQNPTLLGKMGKKAEGQKQRTNAQVEASRQNGRKLKKQTEEQRINSLRSRLLSGYTENDNGCWIWNGSVTHRGYGYLRNSYKIISAHKASFLLHGGVLTNDKPFVLHSCHNRRCINPRHLRCGTAQDNSNDMVTSCRQAKGELAGSSKLCNQSVLEIRKGYENGKTIKELVSIFGTTRRNIDAIVKRKTWKHI